MFESNEQSEAWFYSRTAFGELAVLGEFSKNFSCENSYRASLKGANEKTDSRLSSLLAKAHSSLSSYQAIRRIVFENSPEMERMTELVKERLRQAVSNHLAAFDAIWRRLNSLAMRVSETCISADAQHRLSKGELERLLKQSGSVITPPLAMEEILSSFQSTSAVGRAWKTDIAGRHLSNPAVEEVMQSIVSAVKSTHLP